MKYAIYNGNPRINKKATIGTVLSSLNEALTLVKLLQAQGYEPYIKEVVSKI